MLKGGRALRQIGEGPGGYGQIAPLLLLPRDQNRGGGGGSPATAWPAALGLMAVKGWGKGRGSRCGSIPPLNLGGGGLWRRGHGGGRRPALVLAVAALRGSTAAGVRGEREREVRRSYSPPYLEQRQCEEAAPQWPARGGGAGELVRGLAAAVRFVVVAEHDVKAYL